MRIASNTPSSFYRESGYEFVQLGIETDQAAMIVLMLEKNWGSASIDKIKALTYWLKMYPKEVPCFLVGCESTIPNENVEKFHHKDRDDAIRDLCDEVLIRSKSIGVRGKITFAYLTRSLGYTADQVDLIYEKNANDNSQKLRNFLKKNHCPLNLEKSFAEFQAKPFVVYERSITYEENVVISRPYVTVDGDAVRLNSDIRIDGQIRTLWCETNISYRQFLLYERVDAFLAVLLPFAMRAGKNIICEAPVSENFLHNLTEILVPQLCAHDSRLYATEIIADSDSSNLICGHAVATGMSCGVDSFYTASLYINSRFPSMNLTHLYCGNYLYGNDGPIYERASRAARDLNLPLVRTSTNINEALNLPHLFTHFYKTMFGVLALRKLFRAYYYSTAEDFSHFDLRENSVRDTSKFELLLLYAFNCSDFQLITGGAKSERLEKTRQIAEFAAAQKYLNVCLHPEKERNCGKCGKCMRTLLMLDMLGKLAPFDEVFDLEEYSRCRLDSFVYLVSVKKSPMLADVYKYFAETEPMLIGEAESIAKRVSAKN